MSKKPTKAPVSTRALIQRINRKLAPDHLAVKKCREGSRPQDNLGDYYLLDTYRNYVKDAHINLEAYGRKLGVIAEWEELA